MFKRIAKFFKRFNMCRCTSPEYEVFNSVLCCSICHKPVKWEAKYRD